MKKPLFIGVLLVIFLTCVTLLHAQSGAQLTFDQANDQLQNGNFQEALTYYHKLENNNEVSGPLFLNMGISYVQLDSLGKAKYYFLKASNFEETKTEAHEALQYVESQFSRQSAVLPKLPWERAVTWLQNNIGVDTLLGIGILLLNIGIIGYVVTWFWSEWNTLLHLLGLGLTGLGLVIILASFYVHYVDKRYSPAVMIHEQTHVLEKPGSGASIVSQAFEGYSFTVDQYKSKAHPGWSYVRMSSGLYGWIPSTEILVL